MKSSFTYEQWIEQIKSIETIQEYSAFEEMLRDDCRNMLGEWGPSKVTDLTSLMNQKLREISPRSM